MAAIERSWFRRTWWAIAALLLLAHAGALHAGRAPSPLANDAWDEQRREEQATLAGFEQRFPLHGVAFHVLAQVMSEASERAEVIGYMRRGAQFRATTGRAGRGCDRSWHELASGGFVCAGRGFALSPRPAGFEGAPMPPALDDALPYRYAKHLAKASLQYWRVPTQPELELAAKWLAAAPAQLLHTGGASAEAAELPELKLPEFARMPMQPGFYVSLDQESDAADQAFARTVRGAYVEHKTLSDVSLGRAPGVVLEGADDLPLGIAYKSVPKAFQRDAASGELRPGTALERYTSVRLSGSQYVHEGKTLEITRDGMLLPSAALRVIDKVVRPPLVPRGARFIRVDLAQQTLIAYDGPRPVFATLVSTGKEGYETPKGIYRIYAKHVSATMDGMAGNDEVYSIEDVPWTMYFQGSYALHGAFWHDRFGNVRSHGCVNLAPADARWLFRFATPVLPAGWHGVIATRENAGTWLVIE